VDRLPELEELLSEGPISSRVTDQQLQWIVLEITRLRQAVEQRDRWLEIWQRNAWQLRERAEIAEDEVRRQRDDQTPLGQALAAFSSVAIDATASLIETYGSWRTRPSDRE